MKKLLSIIIVSFALTSCGKWVPKPGPYFAYKQMKANEAKTLVNDSTRKQ